MNELFSKIKLTRTADDPPAARIRFIENVFADAARAGDWKRVSRLRLLHDERG